MVKRYFAQQFLGRADAGRSRPPLCVVAHENDQRDVFLKAAGLHTNLTVQVLVAEWMAARLARDLNLPCPEPIQVELTDQFIESVYDEQLQSQLYEAPRIAFASRNLGNQWHLLPKGASFPAHQLPMLVSIYVFDTLLQNWDRSIDNPNLLKKGDQIAILDHEESFDSALTLAGSRRLPWQLRGIDNYYAGTAQHILWTKLRPQSKVDFGRALDDWKGLPVGVFQRYVAEIPSEWDVAAAQRIADYLGLACQNIDPFIEQLQNALAGG